VTNAEAAATDAAAQKAYDDAVAELDMAAKEEALKQAEEKVKSLEEKSAASKIVSRYGGVVTEVNIAAGDTTTVDEPLMVVELTEKGYTLTATVTKAQAQTLREGLEAEITNLWNSNITMKLTSISNDKSDPSGSKQLTFSVTGDDVSVGQSLSFSIGDKNASYDVVIPSSAIHTDADGSFVYTVQVKSSPLGNRYTVKKKTVTVLASDDTSSAVSGELSTADFVITTSTVPLEVGDQVRIAE
jgi:multidrug efflux pump subunit AcrA (membrane-fusion protein)